MAHWSSLLLAYGAVQGPMWVGLARARAEFSHYVLSPVVAAPLLAMSAAVSGASGGMFQSLGFTQPAAAQWVLGAALGAALGYAAGRAPRRHTQTHLRGSLVEPPPAAPPSSRSGRAASVQHEQSITLAGRVLREQDETKHFKLIGTTGTGKSTAISELLGSALARGDRAVIADPDGGYARRFFRADRGDVILNPFDARSVKWDLFAEIKTHYDVDQLARSLIPDHEGADRSWRGYARTFFSAVTRQAYEVGVRDTAELYRLLVVADAKDLRKLVEGTPAQPFLDEHNSRMFDSIRSVTSSAVGALEYISRQSSRNFSVREWVDKESKGVLFIPYTAGQIAALRSPISAWMRLAIFEAMEREEPPTRAAADARRLWFVVDELDALGQIDGLKDALARLRKFGGRCVLGFQSVAQVSSTYGPGDAHTIVENCGNTLILRCSASEGGGTARFASQLIGEREVMRTTESRTRRMTELGSTLSRSEHYAIESAVMASQIEQLPDLIGYFKQASDPRWHQVRLDARQLWAQHEAQIRPLGTVPALLRSSGRDASYE